MNPANWPRRGPSYKLPDGTTVRVGLPPAYPHTPLPEVSWREPHDDEIFHTPDGVVYRGSERIFPRGTTKGLPWYRRAWLWLHAS